jgi:hypothetical protein
MNLRPVRVTALAVTVLGALAMTGYANQDQQSEAVLGKAVFTKDAIATVHQPYGKKEEPEEHWAFYVNFDKKKPEGPMGCNANRPQGIFGGLLECKITAPPEAKGHITHVEVSCNAGDGGKICGYVHECPANGTCQDYNYAYDPYDLKYVKTRTVIWHGWTNDGNSAILRFDVFMSEKDEH